MPVSRIDSTRLRFFFCKVSQRLSFFSKRLLQYPDMIGDMCTLHKSFSTLRNSTLNFVTYEMYFTLYKLLHFAFYHVRLAERSKAPDSSLKGFPLRSILVHECGRGFESHIWQRFSNSTKVILSNLNWRKFCWDRIEFVRDAMNAFCSLAQLGKRMYLREETLKSFAPIWKGMEDRGIDPRASRMRIERSTTWARPPYHSHEFVLYISSNLVVHIK